LDLNSASAVRRRESAFVVIFGVGCGLTEEEVVVVSTVGGAINIGGNVGIKTLRCEVTG
jgi:hypothetical protein